MATETLAETVWRQSLQLYNTLAEEAPKELTHASTLERVALPRKEYGVLSSKNVRQHGESSTGDTKNLILVRGLDKAFRSLCST